VNLGRTQREQALDLSRLIVRMQVEVDARWYLQRRTNLVEREMRPGPVGRAEQHEVVAFTVVSAHVAECRLPELRLALQIVHAQDDRADPNHPGDVTPEAALDFT
jgi:hypothetical protein